MRQKVRRHGDVAHAGLAPCDGLHTTICGTMPEQSYRLLRPVRTSKLMSREDPAKRQATTVSREFCQRLHEEAVRWLLLRQVGIGTTLIDRPVCNGQLRPGTKQDDQSNQQNASRQHAVYPVYPAMPCAICTWRRGEEPQFYWRSNISDESSRADGAWGKDKDWPSSTKTSEAMIA